MTAGCARALLMWLCGWVGILTMPVHAASVRLVVVEDHSGAVVRSASVTLTLGDGRVLREVETDEQGNVSFDELATGQYALEMRYNRMLWIG